MVKPQNMPHYLNNSTINLWSNRVIDFFNTKTGENIASSFLNTLTIEFSEEEPRIEYKIKNIEKIKKAIKKRWPKVPNDLLGRLDQKEDFENIIRGLADTLSGYVRLDCDEIYRILNKEVSAAGIIRSKFGGCVTGRYFHLEKKIILYNKAIQKGILCTKSFEQCYEEVFAHEMFHALHYEVALSHSDEIILRSDYTSKVVTESLAAWFEKEYCGFNKIECDIEQDWYSVSAIAYPYSGAREFRNSHHFNEVFIASFEDMDKAFRMLFRYNKITFYDIKNLKEDLIVKAPVGVSPSSLFTQIELNCADARLNLGLTYIEIEDLILGLKPNQHGTKAKRILQKLGIPSSFRGMLGSVNIDEVIAISSGIFKDVLIALK